MHVLVTGGAGYLGSVLSRQLLEVGHQVVCYDLLLHGIEPIEALLDHPHFRLVRADVRDREVLAHELERTEAVIHLASIVGAPAVARDPAQAEEVNVLGSQLVNWLRPAHVPVIFTSTGSVYGRVADVCTESTPPNPLSDYGRQKLIAERAFIERGNAVIFRPATAFGLSPRMRLDLLPNDFVWQAIHVGRIEIFEPNAKRTFIHVTDFARAFLHALANLGAMTDQVYNLGSEQMNYSKLAMARFIQKHVSYELVAGEGRDPDARDYTVDYSKIRAAGYATFIDMAEGLRDMIAPLAAMDYEGHSNA